MGDDFAFVVFSPERLPVTIASLAGRRSDGYPTADVSPDFPKP